MDFNTVTINNLEFADISSNPTTLAGAVDFTGATSVDFTGATITGTSFLTSYTETDPVVGAITGLVKSDGAGNIQRQWQVQIIQQLLRLLILQENPTTLAGYGITDALASGGALTGSSLDTNTIQTSSGNLALPRQLCANKQ